MSDPCVHILYAVERMDRGVIPQRVGMNKQYWTLRRTHLMARYYFFIVLYLHLCNKNFWILHRTVHAMKHTTTKYKIDPRPLSATSVYRTEGREKSGECKSVPPYKTFLFFVFTCTKANFQSSIHWTGLDLVPPFLVRPVSRLVTSEILGTNYNSEPDPESAFPVLFSGLGRPERKCRWHTSIQPTHFFGFSGVLPISKRSG